jgi:DNA mismatch repair protein MutL
MSRVALLPDDLINQIAAGEVVERPASVLKELVENAVDAGARTIRVVLSDGGLGRVRVTDDGHGMSAEDAQLALQRHATSKLRDLEGLSRIVTLGFRGEALPSIASVSRFELRTSEPGAHSGACLRVEGGGQPLVEESASVGGTVITVDDLFFNTPARRKFLKHARTEQSHAEEALLRVALAHPEIGFFLEADGRPLLTSPASGDLRDRVAAALGTEVHPHLLAVDERRLGLRVQGHVASPEFTLNTQKGLYTFVNGRFVRDRGMNHAIQRAFQDSLPPGRQPVAVLFVEMDPREVDVNVHPQKLEVRFSDPRSIHELLVSAVQAALARARAAQETAGVPSAAAAPEYALAVQRFLDRAREGTFQPRAEDAPLFPAAAGVASPGFGQLRPDLNQAPPPGFFDGLRVLGLLGRRFYVCEARGGTLAVLDPHAARERLHLCALRDRVRGKGRGGAAGLFSATVEVPSDLARKILQRKESLSRLGWEVDDFGGNALSVQGDAPELATLDLAEILGSLAPVLPPVQDADPESFNAACRLLACAYAGHAEHEPTGALLQGLFQELDRADFASPARHGRLVLSEIPLLELQHRADATSGPEN